MKKIVLCLLFVTMQTLVTAHDFRFDEMTYSPEKTVFRLFAPTDAKVGKGVSIPSTWVAVSVRESLQRR